MIKSRPIYLYQCVECRKIFKTSNVVMKHCGTLTQWLKGIEGIGIDLKEVKLRTIKRGRG